MHFVGSCEDVPMPSMRGADAIVLYFQVAPCLNNSTVMTRAAMYYLLLDLRLSSVTTVRQLVYCIDCVFKLILVVAPVCATNVYYVNILPLTAMPTTPAKQESDSEDLDYVPEDHGMACYRILSYSSLRHAFSF